jgi:hypothetical protein
MNAWVSWIFLLLWVSSQALQLVFGVLAMQTSEKKLLGSLKVSALASILPSITLILFITVFVIGGSSNVAQLAGEAGQGLWTLWAGFWPLLFIGNPIAFFVALVTAFFPPYPPTHWKSLASRVSAVVAASFAWYVSVMLFPDA